MFWGVIVDVTVIGLLDGIYLRYLCGFHYHGIRAALQCQRAYPSREEAKRWQADTSILWRHSRGLFVGSAGPLLFDGKS